MLVLALSFAPCLGFSFKGLVLRVYLEGLKPQKLNLQA
jgi:hypothetical protein